TPELHCQITVAEGTGAAAVGNPCAPAPRRAARTGGGALPPRSCPLAQDLLLPLHGAFLWRPK
ncbi:MAG: hypothetical protein V4484_24175, partial [Pseudomonadota bacterium]